MRLDKAHKICSIGGLFGNYVSEKEKQEAIKKIMNSRSTLTEKSKLGYIVSYLYYKYYGEKV